VKPRAPRRFPFYVVALLVVGFGIFGVVTIQTLVSQSSFRLQRLTKENSVLQETNAQLALQVAQLSAPGRIASQAEVLGLRPPTRVETIKVKLPVPGADGQIPGRSQDGLPDRLPSGARESP